MTNFTGIVCHDAGGAQLLSFWANAYHGDYLICVEGPAQLIFKQNKVRADM